MCEHARVRREGECGGPTSAKSATSAWTFIHFTKIFTISCIHLYKLNKVLWMRSNENTGNGVAQAASSRLPMEAFLAWLVRSHLCRVAWAPVTTYRQINIA